jgi:hypothetical protein
MQARRTVTPPTHGHDPDAAGFGDRITYWLDDIDLEGWISRTTRKLL